MTQRRIVVLRGPDEVAVQAAYEFEVRARAAIAEHGRFAVALSGGRTPFETYSLLAAPRLSESIQWPNVQFFWGDERCVPPDHPESNYGQARKALLEAIQAPAENVHRMRGELAPNVGAVDYADQLSRFFGGSVRLDLVYLGLGADGHTASLFPHSPALAENDAPCVVSHVASNPIPWRLTLTYPVLNAARAVIFLVVGHDKCDVLARVLEGPRDSASLPAQGIEPSQGSLVWLVDQAAAARLGTHA